jgi:hypothetical protein
MGKSHVPTPHQEKVLHVDMKYSSSGGGSLVPTSPPTPVSPPPAPAPHQLLPLQPTPPHQPLHPPAVDGSATVDVAAASASLFETIVCSSCSFVCNCPVILFTVVTLIVCVFVCVLDCVCVCVCVLVYACLICI